MGRYIARRLLSMIPVLLLVTIISFSLILLTGDPVKAMLGQEADPATVKAMRTKLGLDDPIPVQYVKWLTRVLQGDLGNSIRSSQPVSEAILQRLPVTIWINVIAFVMTILIGIPAGLISALHRNSPIDLLTSLVSLLGITTPNFFLGILLIFFFSVKMGWLPSSGYVDPLTDPVAGIKTLIMPAITLGTAEAAIIARMTRSSVLEELSRPYMITARAKGLQERLVISRHLIKNAMIPVVTILGLQVGISFGGAVVTETIFALPGLGRLAVTSISARDFPMVQGAVLVMAIAFLLANLIVDLLYAYLDPRIRYQ
ncbi:MAG: ABC transporter permease [Chloroflexi bacterium]|nr:ABC transporter permease [Chloroflexota bacterium]